ncbi:MAG: beta-ketoacyl synthase N-terminal-like domain-containing protein [Aestuariibacter sp.]
MPDSPKIVVSGLGITSSIGQGCDVFLASLLNAETAFAPLSRPGRQCLPGQEPAANHIPFIGAELQELVMPDSIKASSYRTASLSGKVALATAWEAYKDAGLEEMDSGRLGLLVGGSNFQQRELLTQQAKYANKAEFLRPTYAMGFMDTDVCGLCTEQLGIKGLAFTVGGASASGQLAIIQGIEAVYSGRVDACVVLGALMDLSFWECQGFRAIGAMGSQSFYEQPELASRPFDKNHDGFIFGESCGAVVIETQESAVRRGAAIYAEIRGWAVAMDANRNPDPSADGEIKVITEALKMAKLSASEIDYVNPHGTGSIIGDETELAVLRQTGLNHAAINTTKSILGHGLSAAGSSELVATILQLKGGKLHPCRNLDNPIADDFNWVTDSAKSQQIKYAIKMSMGFGGVNTAVCLRNPAN